MRVKKEAAQTSSEMCANVYKMRQNAQKVKLGVRTGNNVPDPCIQALGLPHPHPVSVGRDDE